MDDDRYARAIRRAFEPFEMSAGARMPATVEGDAPESVRRWGLLGRLPRLALPVAVAAVAAVLAITALAPAGPAFASWRSVPADAAPAVVTAAEAACKRAEPDHLAALGLVGSEQRGAYTMLLFTDGQGGAYGLCLTGEDIAPMVLAGSGPSTGTVDVPSTGNAPSATGTRGDHGTPSWSDLPPIHFVAMPAAGQPVTQRVQAFVIGISPEVTRLEIERTGAEPAVATLIDGGLAFVWWPTGSMAGDIVAYDADGNAMDRLPADFLSH
ncbi:MAG: hypothetical protein ABIZ34_06665 [Candidatus Limnocylindrales bacterium]